MTCMIDITEARELDARSADGIEVRLLWHPATEILTVVVFDATHGREFELVVDAEDALDAFHHPFAYAAFQGVPYGAPLSASDEEPIVPDVWPSFSEA